MSIVDANKGKILKITKSGNKFFKEEAMSLPELPNWPIGDQGELIIENGETIQVAAGTILDYSLIDIKAGGVLEVASGANYVVTYIGCTGNIIIDGEIRARSSLSNSATVNETIEQENITFNLVQKLGGTGGRTFAPVNGLVVPTSAGTNGYGGGGAGGSSKSPNFPTPASTGFPGGTNNGNGLTGFPNPGGGIGGFTLGNGLDSYGPIQCTVDGVSVDFDIFTDSVKGANGGGSGGGVAQGITSTNTSPAGVTVSCAVSGGGAGGGFKGKHGLPIYLYAKGSITGSGLINLSGTNGFNGGSAASPGPLAKFGPISPSMYSQGGAAGGGGAGGSGGFLWVRHGNGFSVPFSVSGGIGGSTGTNGVDQDGLATADSNTAGQNGDDGGSDIQEI